MPGSGTRTFLEPDDYEASLRRPQIDILIALSPPSNRHPVHRLKNELEANPLYPPARDDHPERSAIHPSRGSALSSEGLSISPPISLDGRSARMLCTVAL